MTDRPIYFVPSDDIPAAQIEGVTGIVDIVDLTHIDESLNLARRAFKRREELANSPDTIESLRRDLNALADAVMVLAPELHSLARGVERGRIGISRS